MLQVGSLARGLKLVHSREAMSAVRAHQPLRSPIGLPRKGGEEPALLLLHHTDVVTADEAFWDVPAFEGVVRDGYIYGRGALDMKSHGILHLSAFLALHRAGKPLKRDVIFMATAAEHVVGRPDLFDPDMLMSLRAVCDDAGYPKTPHLDTTKEC